MAGSSKKNALRYICVCMVWLWAASCGQDDGRADELDVGVEDVGGLNPAEDVGNADDTTQADGESDIGRRVSWVEISPEHVRLGPDAQVQAQASVYDVYGAQFQDAVVEWETDDPQIASVDGQGLVQAESVGETRLRAQFEGVSQAVPVTVTAVDSLSISPQPGEVGVGGSLQLTVEAYDADGHEIALSEEGVSWSSEQPQIGSVDDDGLLTGQQAGFVHVNARVGEAQVQAEFRVEVKFESMRCYGWFCCANSRESGLYCWYDPTGSPDNNNILQAEYRGRFPQKVDTDLYFVDYAYSTNGTMCGLTEEGVAYCWGANLWYTISGEGLGERFMTPTRLDTDLRFSKIGLGGGGACGLGVEGGLYCWGIKPFHVLTTKLEPTDQYEPTPYLVSDKSYSDLKMSDSILCVLEGKGEWSCMGEAPVGLVGEPDDDGALSLTPIESPEPLVEMIPAGASGAAACGFSASHQVYCQGKNIYEVLGYAADPLRTHETFERTDWDIQANRLFATDTLSGAYYCLEEAQTQDILCWGTNISRAGLGPQFPVSVESSHIPEKIEGLPDDIKQVSWTCALTHSGDIWCWAQRDRSSDAPAYEGPNPYNPWPQRVYTF